MIFQKFVPSDVARVHTRDGVVHVWVRWTATLCDKPRRTKGFFSGGAV
jgi:hypothetical protein